MLYLHRILNKMLHLRSSAGFLKCFDFSIHQSCEYTRVLNMSGLHKVLNKTASVKQGSVENGPSYSSGSQYVRVEYTRVVNISRLQRVLSKLYFKDSRYLECLEF